MNENKPFDIYKIFQNLQIISFQFHGYAYLTEIIYKDEIRHFSLVDKEAKVQNSINEFVETYKYFENLDYQYPFASLLLTLDSYRTNLLIERYEDAFKCINSNLSEIRAMNDIGYFYDNKHLPKHKTLDCTAHEYKTIWFHINGICEFFNREFEKLKNELNPKTSFFDVNSKLGIIENLDFIISKMYENFELLEVLIYNKSARIGSKKVFQFVKLIENNKSYRDIDLKKLLTNFSQIQTSALIQMYFEEKSISTNAKIFKSKYVELKDLVYTEYFENIKSNYGLTISEDEISSTFAVIKENFEIILDFNSRLEYYEHISKSSSSINSKNLNKENSDLKKTSQLKTPILSDTDYIDSLYGLIKTYIPDCKKLQFNTLFNESNLLGFNKINWTGTEGALKLFLKKQFAKGYLDIAEFCFQFKGKDIVRNHFSGGVKIESKKDIEIINTIFEKLAKHTTKK